MPGKHGSMLLDLPDPCLLAVMRELAEDDQHSLFNAARAHSRLRQLTIPALCSIVVQALEQQQADSVLQYLRKHGQHMDSVVLWGSWAETITLQDMPPLLQLTNLQFLGVRLQLRPGNGFQGVLGAAAPAEAPPLKQLKLLRCALLDGEAALAAALSLLPALEHLEISKHPMQGECLQFLADVFAADLQQLTHLTLHGVTLQGPSQQALQEWRGLSRLESLDLAQHMFAPERYTIPASLLQSAHHLTRMVLKDFASEPGVLAGKTRLQHLNVSISWDTVVQGTWAAQVLSHLQHLQQLTHLDLDVSIRNDEADPPAAPYSALTASSKLQFLHVSGWAVPAAAWQHVFPAGRQLPHLTSLNIAGLKRPTGGWAAAPEGSRLVSCCPGLQALDVQGLHCPTGTLASLVGLSGLHTLRMGGEGIHVQGLQELSLLTGLRELFVWAPHCVDEGLLLQLTALKQLTELTYGSQWDEHDVVYNLSLEVTDEGWEAPVWRQLLQLHLKHSDPQVVQKAAAALAEEVAPDQPCTAASSRAEC